MANKTLNTRIQHKTDTAANWSQAENFSPLKGELIIYQEGNNSKIKIGDGNTNVNNLPFVAEIIDVLELPIENIKENVTYRLLQGQFVSKGLFRYDSTCYIVEWDKTPSTTGESVLIETENGFAFNGYYNKKNNTVYGYFAIETADLLKARVDASDLSSLEKTLAKAAIDLIGKGWKALEEIFNLVGSYTDMTYGGVITSKTQINDATKAYIYLTYADYIYRNNNWIQINDEILHGEGNSSEVFNSPLNIATGVTSHAEGYLTQALETQAHAEGYNTKAQGKCSHTEGYYTYAKGIGAHAEGYNDIKDADGNEIDITTYGAHGNASHAEGVNTLSTGKGAHAEGRATTAISDYAHAEGYDTSAEGIGAHSEGRYSTAKGNYSHTEGYSTTARGNNAHAEGGCNTVAPEFESTVTNDEIVTQHKSTPFTLAKGNNSHSEGHSTMSLGIGGHSEGRQSVSVGDISHAEGDKTYAYGVGSHSEGVSTESKGNASHAEGSFTISEGKCAHAEGRETVAIGENSHAEGYNTNAFGNYSHAEGNSSREYNPTGKTIDEIINDHDQLRGDKNSYLTYELKHSFSLAYGVSSHTEGKDTLAVGEYSHAEGENTEASGYASHAEGGGYETFDPTIKYITKASGSYSHAEGFGTKASGYATHSEGGMSKAKGSYSHAEGENTTAIGEHSHAEGFYTTTIGNGSHAEGYSNTAFGKYSHTEGSGMSYIVPIEMGEANVTTYSVDNQIKLEDRLCIGAIITAISYIDPNTNNMLEADNINAKVISIDKDNLTFTVDKTLLNASFTNAIILVHANQLAVSLHSHVEGTGNIAYGRSQHIQGEFNDIDPEYKNNDQEARCKYAHIIGNGTSISNRSNAHTVDWDGNAEYQGDVKAYACGGETPISLKNISDRLQLLETLLANLTYDAENNTYIFDAKIIEKQ